MSGDMNMMMCVSVIVLMCVCVMSVHLCLHENVSVSVVDTCTISCSTCKYTRVCMHICTCMTANVCCKKKGNMLF